MGLFVRDGNLRGIVCVVLFLIGITVVYAFVEYYYGSIRIFGISLGMALMAIGGYSAKASALHLRPFDTSPWRRAKATYDEPEKTIELEDSTNRDSDDSKSE
ncbi:hypothetical protein [Cupriavidus metallidurans]|uniref:hypothetical protein n=1 Tax=Cupriavidus metallidurans TaxID=119219 RepID=UPI000A751E17|nr:hypothetical protein [Cupriavidus metallidurans]